MGPLATFASQTQTWHDVSGSRAFNTTYTNSNGRAIAVSLSISYAAGANAQLKVGSLVIGEGASGSGSAYFQLSAIVPVGATYTVTTSGGSPAIINWAEYY